MEAPLLLTHVCRAWRQIAITTPALWTTFDIQNASSLPRLPEIATAWFERARKCSLSVRIHGSLKANVTFLAFMEPFRKHSREMRSLELHTGVEDFNAMDAHFEALDLSLLQKLLLRHLNDSDEDFPTTTIRMFHNVPLLHDVLMAEVPPTFVALPWQQLTKFTGERYTVEECLDALRLMPNLVDCSFCVFDDDTDGLEIFSHPNIQHLTLFESTPQVNLYASDFGEGASSARILTLVTLPALQTLEIQGVDDFEEDELDLFLSRSSPPLRKLIVRPLPSWEGCTTLQFNTPFTGLGLAELEIWHPSRAFLGLFFNFLGWDSGLLPQLRKLSLQGCGAGHGVADVYEILLMAAVPIAKRRAGVAGYAQLQSFHAVHQTFDGVYESTEYPEKILLPFRILKASGLDVYIQVGSQKESVI
ncbi:F-box domain-containing protein [Mycena venus]|uniref:F-box domain-containing protein n=1 Tax=Mycena venus TaxID=2733690 RepID=A0A8H6Y489_9AGAR|nr:F-box domain-containing protein [Mycena venus]